MNLTITSLAFRLEYRRDRCLWREGTRCPG